MSSRLRTGDDLTTPGHVLDRIVQYLGPIDLDPCSNEWSIVPARRALSIDRGEDGLAARWAGLTYENPPYGPGHLPRWSAKAALEVTSSPTLELVTLVPCSPDTTWFRQRVDISSARVDLDKRLRFGGGAHGSGTFASTLFYAGRRPFLFAHAFADLGEVRIYRQPRIRP